jgi:hypothetical protein
MSYYVKIQRLNGRIDHMKLGEWLNQSGVVEVDYHRGGWEDKEILGVHPHLKFENEPDAIAYVLANGGVVSKEVPKMIPGTDFIPGG